MTAQAPQIHASRKINYNSIADAISLEVVKEEVTKFCNQAGRSLPQEMGIINAITECGIVYFTDQGTDEFLIAYLSGERVHCPDIKHLTLHFYRKGNVSAIKSLFTETTEPLT